MDIHKHDAIFRNEYKYICRASDIEALVHRIKHIIPMDIHSGTDGYIISSLYFDDINDSCCRENEAGISRRYKYRIRFYNNDSSFISLEKKEKWQEKCRKTSCAITKNELDMLCSGDLNTLSFDGDRPLLREFSAQISTRLFRPKAVIRYQRRAFYTCAGNVRITFDTNITASSDFSGFLNGRGLYIPVQNEGYNVVEVKFDEFLPDYILNTLQTDVLYRTTFSKYYYGRSILNIMEGK